MTVQELVKTLGLSVFALPNGGRAVTGGTWAASSALCDRPDSERT